MITVPQMKQSATRIWEELNNIFAEDMVKAWTNSAALMWKTKGSQRHLRVHVPA